MGKRPVTVALLVCALALAASGCGANAHVEVGNNSTPTVDPAKIEPELATQLAKGAGVNPSDVKLSCPSGEPAKKGNRFQCTLTAPDGTTGKVNVTVTSVKVSNGEAQYHVEGFVPPGQFKN